MLKIILRLCLSFVGWYRVVSSALKCFHDLTEKIESGHCGTDGAAEYRRSYIQPVVDQSRHTVTTRYERRSVVCVSVCLSHRHHQV